MNFKLLYQIHCFITEHNRNEEVVPDDNTIRCYCKRDNYLQLGWSHVGEYKKFMGKIPNMVRKQKWNKN